jgi:hypothetical protein
MKIEVTQRDIDRALKIKKEIVASGNYYSPSKNCPIALACKRTLKRRVCAAGGQVDVFYGPEEWNCKGRKVKEDKVVAKFQIEFDNNKPVKPFSFNLE